MVRWGKNSSRNSAITLRTVGQLKVLMLTYRGQSMKAADGDFLLTPPVESQSAHFARNIFQQIALANLSDESLSVRLARRSERPRSMHPRNIHALSAQIVGPAPCSHPHSL